MHYITERGPGMPLLAMLVLTDGFESILVQLSCCGQMCSPAQEIPIKVSSCICLAYITALAQLTQHSSLQCRFKASEDMLLIVDAFCTQAGLIYGSMSPGRQLFLLFVSVSHTYGPGPKQVCMHCCSFDQEHYLPASAGGPPAWQSEAAQVNL